VVEYIEPLEIIKHGHATGRYRLTIRSDESASAPWPLCGCPDGHETREEAQACPEARHGQY
jgi:hypothetical protein